MEIVIVGLLLGGTYASMAVRFRGQGSPIEKIKPCIVVWFPPARSTAPRTTTTSMSHVASQEALNGNTSEWIRREVTGSTSAESQQENGDEEENTRKERT